MPGPVSDSYDPEFGTGENAHDVAEGLHEVVDLMGESLGDELKNIVEVAQGGEGQCVYVRLSERHRRLIRFGLNRALESI